MDHMTLYRTIVYSPNQRGELVELRRRRAASAEEAIALADRDARRKPLGAVAYAYEIDAEGQECGPSEVLGRFGNVPHPQPFIDV